MRFMLAIAVTLSILAFPGHAQNDSAREQAMAAVVRVEVSDADFDVSGAKLEIGTGFIWLDSLHVVTACHVAMAGRHIRVRRATGQGEWRAKVERVLPIADLALLKLESDSGLPALEDGTLPAQGTQCVVWGFQLGKNTLARSPVWISADRVPFEELLDPAEIDLVKAMTYPGLLERATLFSGFVHPGFSGAPVFDARWNVVAVISGGETGRDGIFWVFRQTSASTSCASRKKSSQITCPADWAPFSGVVLPKPA